MVLEERLAKINDKFKMEISVIKEYLEFMEMSVVLTGLKSKNHSLLDAGMDSSDINNIQNKIESLRLKNKWYFKFRIKTQKVNSMKYRNGLVL